jgi:hypothetical protein
MAWLPSAKATVRPLHRSCRRNNDHILAKRDIRLIMITNAISKQTLK